MPLFANSLRQLLGRGQPASSSTPDSIARFDGTSDSHIQPQQIRQSVSLQEGNNGELATARVPESPPPGRYGAAGQESALQPVVQHQTQSMQQFATQQGEHTRGHTQSLMHSTPELSHASRSQYDDSSRQISSRTATAQPSSPSHAGEYPHAMNLVNPHSYTSTQVEVKKEPSSHEDDDIFAEFTNEKLHEDDAQMEADDGQPAGHAIPKAFSIKRGSGCENQLPITVTGGAETFGSAITTGRGAIGNPTTMADQGKEPSSLTIPNSAVEKGTSAWRVHSKPERPQSYTSSNPPVHIHGSQQQYSFEQYAQDPRQSVSRSQAQPCAEQSLRSLSADSVIGAQRHSSEETASSSGSMDLKANLRSLERQWKDRYKLSGMDPLTAEAVQANPVLLHSPSPSQEQYGQRLSLPTLANQPPTNPPVYHTQPMHGLQHNSTFPYNFNVPFPSYSVAAQSGQGTPQWMRPDSHSAPSMHPNPVPGIQFIQSPLLQGAMNSHRITALQNDRILEAPDDEGPLATPTVRQRPTTANPTPPGDSEKATSSSDLDPATAASTPSVPGSKQDAAIELSDDEDEPTEPISWKLPDFEVTYHPPATDKDLPMAKVSILGLTNNLVRSEVALTEDHAQQEIELFLNVFLPAQQALPTPDPEPAHAVINFHTISVMVLEAFVQYEIGDEMGRGYGFHGGNIANQALRPSLSSSDVEPPRTRSAKDADVDEIFFAVIDRWRAGLISGKGTLKVIRGCQEFCDIALDVIHYVKEHGVSQPEPKKRKERSDKGVKRKPKSGEKQTETKPKASGKRKADAMENKMSAKKNGKVNELTARKKAKVEIKKKPKAKGKSSGVTVLKGKK